MWDMNFNQRVLCGAGKFSQIGQVAKGLGNKVLVVTSRAGIKGTGIVEKLEEALKREGVGCFVYKGIDPDPDINSIDEGVRSCLAQECDMVIGIGGGSAMDAAKVIAMLAVNGGSAREYQMGEKMVKSPTLPVIAVPTTAGTGSEATRVSVVSNIEAGIKKSIAHPFMIPAVALIDPELMVSLPVGLTASTGMDALGHAIESYVSLNANPVTEAFGLRAIELITDSLLKAVEDGSNIIARESMAAAAYMAGCALNAGVGIAHIIGQPLGAVYHIPHGDAISIMLPAAMEINLDHSPQKYANIAAAMKMDCHGLTIPEAGKMSIEAVGKLRERIGAPKTLRDAGVSDKSGFMELMDSIRHSTAHIQCNPRPVNEDVLLKTLEIAF